MASNETLLNNRYRLVAQQGSGGMAVIYKAIDVLLGRTVAVKILRPSLSNDDAFLTRFQNEARSVAKLAHPNIVTVHDVGHEGPTHYIVMEFIEGQDLKKIIRTAGVVGIERALNLSIQICAGIGFAHRASLVHADVKPQNILVTKEDIVKVTDFGIAQALSDTQPGEQRQAVVWGSPHYFSPEQARGEKPTPASDVYAIGIVTFEMLTGRLPYMGASQQELAMAHLREPVPMVTDFNPGVPENLARIVHKTMSKEPSARYRTADQLGNILETYRNRGHEHTVPRSPVGGQSQPSAPQPPVPTQPRQTPVQAPPSYQPSQPVYPSPDPVPTQRYNVAPDAPSPVQYGPPAPSPFDVPAQSQASRPLYQTPPVPPQSSERFQSRPLYDEEPVSGGMDWVTIVLAVLAFFAVACLIPLWIAVLQARVGS
jgi:eukaryotic-like serine/threonine-protein kinase